MENLIFNDWKKKMYDAHNLFIKYKDGEELTNDELKIIIEHLLREINTLSSL